MASNMRRRRRITSIEHVRGRQAALLVTLCSLTVTAAALLGLAAPATAATGAVHSRGAFTCDFELPGDFPFNQVAPALERDRIYMARQPGMLNKHLPIRPDSLTGTLRSGGRYLFNTYKRARDYLRFVSEDFVLDDVQFLDRPFFLNPDCHAWSTIGAHDFTDIHDSRAVLRTERWSVPDRNQRPALKAKWPRIRAAAAARGLSSVWLLYSRAERLVTLVYYDAHTAGHAPDALDSTALAALEAAPPLGDKLVRTGWTKTLDLTHFVLTIWFPNPGSSGDNGEPSLWPNSPPLPQPTPDDGVCEPSRGETSTTAPADCTPSCGDGIRDADEDNRRCPSDVPANSPTRDW